MRKKLEMIGAMVFSSPIGQEQGGGRGQGGGVGAGEGKKHLTQHHAIP